MELVYQYLTGPRFRHRIEAIVEKFSDMQSDLDKERRTMTRLWAKREQQIRGVIESTAGMYGDLQGIAGKALEEIEGIDLPLIEDRLDEDTKTQWQRGGRFRQGRSIQIRRAMSTWRDDDGQTARGGCGNYWDSCFPTATEPSSTRSSGRFEEGRARRRMTE